jgi:hypothetical protein
MRSSDYDGSMNQCTATNRAGQQCGKAAIRGANVCRSHGGAAPQVKRRAEERLASLVAPAIAELGRLLGSKSPSVVLGAVKDILDRNGFKPKDVVVVEGDIVAALNRGLARAGKPPIESSQGPRLPPAHGSLCSPVVSKI